LHCKHTEKFSHSRSWPWLVKITIHDEDTDTLTEQTCHGVSVGPGWVLTDARCCHHAHLYAKISTTTGLTDDSNRFDVTGSDWIVHPEYNIVNAKTAQETGQAASKFNFCMMRLGHVAALGSIEHICLAATPPPPGAWCWVGSSTYSDSFSHKWFTKEKERQWGLNVFSDEYCQATSAYESYNIHLESQFCAGMPDKNKNGLTDVGTGWDFHDNGAPLVCDRDGSATLFGIVAFNQGMENDFEMDPTKEGHPIIFGDVSKVAEWIQEVMENPWQVEKKKRIRPWYELEGIDTDSLWTDYGR